MITRRTVIAGAGAYAMAGCATTSPTSPMNISGRGGAAVANYFSQTPAPFPQFAVIPDTPSHGFNFRTWNAFISRYVIDFGRSDRVARGRPSPAMGSRFVKGHDSPYRTEGNRIPFSVFREKHIQLCVKAREVLEELGNREPMRSYGWSHQLAFWLNLHNAALIEQLALHYPARRPHRLRIGPEQQPLHDAKIVTIHGTPLSLRDIRVEIVYRHWRHPAVIYGFFHGCIGGPSIRQGAYTGLGVRRQLAESAYEFVNSLRGVRAYGGYIAVSRTYEEALPIFKDWRTELRAHLNEFASEDVGELLASDLPMKIQQYDTRIADLAGGDTRISSASRSPMTASTGNFPVGNLDIRALSAIPGLPEHVDRTLKEQTEKDINLRNRARGRRRGRVTIEDLPSGPIY